MWQSKKFKTATLIVAFAVASLALPIVQSASYADAYFDAGVKCYQKKDYRNAAAYFDQSVQNAPWDSSAFYYGALSYQQMGNWDKAKEKYGIIVDRFPGTQACVNATAVLKKFDPTYFTRPKKTDSTATAAPGGAAPAAGGASGGDPASKVEVTAPAQSRLSFQRQGDRMVLDASVNNRSVKMSFGAGGGATVIGKKDLQTMGMAQPRGAGVREPGQSVPSWKVEVTMRVGDIVQKNFPIQVQDEVEHPTLGTEFFEKFAYTVDNNANSILVIKKGGTASAASGYDLPFKLQGADMMVTASINGRNCSVIFDTAGGEITIPKKRAKELGVDVQEETVMQGGTYSGNVNAPQRGETGYGDLKKESSGEVSIKMGPCIKSGVRVKVDENAVASTPRVGAGMFSDWKFTVDQGASVIRFRR